jgi:hypothetical protein
MPLIDKLPRFALQVRIRKTRSHIGADHMLLKSMLPWGWALSPTNPLPAKGAGCHPPISSLLHDYPPVETLHRDPTIDQALLMDERRPAASRIRK